jgi:hypothetical protein
MRSPTAFSLAAAALLALWPTLVPVGAQSPQKPVVQPPQPGVPEIATIEGMYVRAAYNNEGYAIIGYKTANMSVGEPWMLLEMGTTVREGVKNQRLKREALSLTTPDGKTLPLPTVEEYRNVDLRALEQRSTVARDSINYFPPMASQACRMGFFSGVEDRGLPWDEVELSQTRACLGRIYFNVPGGIQYGQHFLNVKFENTLIRIPFRILTKDEEKLLSKNYKDIRKQMQEHFAPKKKK